MWDEKRLAGFDFAHCAARIHPDSSAEEVRLNADWLTWGTYGDDYYPLVFGTSRDLVSARLQHERLMLFMPTEDEQPAPVPSNPLERGLADLWVRTAGPMTPQIQGTFQKAVSDMTESWLWELANMAGNRVPDPIDYVEMRRRTFGSALTQFLSRLDYLDIVPAELYQTRVLHEMDTAAEDVGCFTNDLFSYQKEVEFEGEQHNLVVVVENFLNVDRVIARDIVAELLAARVRQFEQIADVDLPALFEDFNLNEGVRAALTKHAEDLKVWMSGILSWHHATSRYGEQELRRGRIPALEFSFLPTGLGTSAVRIPVP
jgi:germacradienol/geosmin synthase